MKLIKISNFQFVLKFIYREKLSSLSQLLIFCVFSYFLFLCVQYILYSFSGNFNSKKYEILYKIIILTFSAFFFCILGLHFLKLHKRTSGIGIIQSLGATQGQIYKFLLIENFVLISFSSLIGPIIGVLILGDIGFYIPELNIIELSNKIFYFIFNSILSIGIVIIISVLPIALICNQDPYRSIRRGR
jgi:hypothetical protein